MATAVVVSVEEEVLQTSSSSTISSSDGVEETPIVIPKKKSVGRVNKKRVQKLHSGPVLLGDEFTHKVNQKHRNGVVKVTGDAQHTIAMDPSAVPTISLEYLRAQSVAGRRVTFDSRRHVRAYLQERVVFERRGSKGTIQSASMSAHEYEKFRKAFAAHVDDEMSAVLEY